MEFNGKITVLRFLQIKISIKSFKNDECLYFLNPADVNLFLHKSLGRNKSFGQIDMIDRDKIVHPCEFEACKFSEEVSIQHSNYSI